MANVTTNLNKLIEPGTKALLFSIINKKVRELAEPEIRAIIDQFYNQFKVSLQSAHIYDDDRVEVTLNVDFTK